LRGAARVPTLDDLPELTDDERAMAARTWRGRMVNEHVSAAVFAGLVPQLMRAGVDPTAIAEVPLMIGDELRHAEQCAGVVTALGLPAVAPLPPIEPLPEHEDVGRLEAALRNVLSVCCLSETVAVAVIRAEHAELEATRLGAVLAAILADEVRHARFGWRLLGQLAPSLDAEAKARLSAYLPAALRHQIAWEIPKLPVNLGLRPEVAAAGVCDGSLARELFFATIGDVVVPQLEAAGLDARAAWALAQAS
ncbi:MAG TPA: ferritin-like domain-containing protein, partial [Myxococcota bacterium]|nr:ferritin-like domain-containing protein [Myxococcota bacterium]